MTAQLWFHGPVLAAPTDAEAMSRAPTPVAPVVDAIRARGGTADRAALVQATSAYAVRRAIALGVIVPVRRGRYEVPTDPAPAAAVLGPSERPDPWLAEPDPADLQVARRLRGVLSHLSAAKHWGWPTLMPSDAVHVTVPRGRRSTRRQRAGAHIHVRDLHRDEVAGEVTTPLVTVLAVARSMSFPEALAVADSAIRSGLVGRTELRNAADRQRGPHCVQVRRVAEAASGAAFGPFESAVRAVAGDVEGLCLVPQYVISEGPRGEAGSFYARVDLADPVMRIVVEADSAQWHTSPEQQRRDIRRYRGLLRRGWLPVPTSFDDVTVRADEYAADLAGIVALRRDEASSIRPIDTPFSAALQRAGLSPVALPGR